MEIMCFQVKFFDLPKPVTKMQFIPCNFTTKSATMTLQTHTTTERLDCTTAHIFVACQGPSSEATRTKGLGWKKQGFIDPKRAKLYKPRTKWT